MIWGIEMCALTVCIDPRFQCTCPERHRSCALKVQNEWVLISFWSLSSRTAIPSQRGIPVRCADIRAWSVTASGSALSRSRTRLGGISSFQAGSVFIDGYSFIDRRVWQQSRQ